MIHFFRRTSLFWAKSLLGSLLAIAAICFVWDVWGSAVVFSESKGHTVAAAVGPAPSTPVNPDGQLQELQTRIAAAEEKLDVDEKRLDALRARAADIQLFVTILLGLGALYAAAQAVFAFFNVQAMVKAVRDEANVQRTEWQKFQDDCRKQFPRFAGMDEVRTSILGVLTSILRTKESGENLFNRLGVEDRQRVFFYEKSIAGLEFLNLNQTPEDSLKVFRGLGRFYIDKYESENKASKDDLDRGEFYFQLALGRKNDDFRLLNDQGKVQADIYSNFAAATALWKQSLKKDPEQQRAYYDLGTLYFESKEYDKAVEFLREGAKRTRWEEERNQANEGNLYYNLACALWKKAIKDEVAAPESEPIEELKKAIAVFPNLRADISLDPDLKDLVTAVGGYQELSKRLQA